MATNKLMRSKEAADRLGLKPVTIRELEKKGLLKGIRDWAGHRRFQEKDVEEFRRRLLSGNLGSVQAASRVTE